MIQTELTEETDIETDTENTLTVTKGERGNERSSGLAGTNYHMFNIKYTRSCYIAQVTILSIL